MTIIHYFCPRLGASVLTEVQTGESKYKDRSHCPVLDTVCPIDDKPPASVLAEFPDRVNSYNLPKDVVAQCDHIEKGKCTLKEYKGQLCILKTEFKE